MIISVKFDVDLPRRLHWKNVIGSSIVTAYLFNVFDMFDKHKIHKWVGRSPQVESLS